eukprot:CAMPEP_0172179634 /NCGR_PEP_ID=MMETSP1050-20130122/16736_1 /TAXON_ID=233186 /ORGANISM="Cryptomonas curvata, Strain CCAP979/52" /LENGTH=35 /DNA_ID= /DNA_START= /DNA_END= /DNA_ORIENTATION=
MPDDRPVRPPAEVGARDPDQGLPRSLQHLDLEEPL